MGGSGSFFPKDIKYLEYREKDDVKTFPVWVSIASGPKIRKLKRWSKQTEYGGEV